MSRATDNSPDVDEGIGDGAHRSIDGLAFRYKHADPDLAELILAAGPDFVERVTAKGFIKGGVGVSEWTGYEALGKAAGLLTRIDPSNHDLRSTFFRTSLGLIHRYGIDGLERIADCLKNSLCDAGTVARSLLEKSPDIIDRLGYSGLKRIDEIACNARDRERKHWGSEQHGVARYIAENCLELIERGGYPLLGHLADIMIGTGPYEHERPFQALVSNIPGIVRRAGNQVLRSIAVVGRNMSHATWQIPHAVDFIHRIPQIIDRLNSMYDREFVLKFFYLLERLSGNHSSFDGVISYLDGYLESLEKCRELGISDEALDLTCVLTDADTVETKSVFQFWIDFSESVYGVNIRAKDGSAHPDFVRTQNRTSLESHIEQIIIESALHPVTASYLIGYSGKIIELIGYDGLDTVIVDYIQKIPADLNRRSQVYLEVLKCSPDVIKGLLNLGDRKFVRDTYRIVGRLNGSLDLPECVALLKTTPQLTGRIGLDGLRKTLKLYRRIIRDGSSHGDAKGDFLLLLNDAPDIINAIGVHGGKHLITAVYRHAERLARHGPRLPYELLVNAPEILAIGGLDGIERVSKILPEIGVDDMIAGLLVKSIPAIVERLGYDGIARSANLGRRIWRHSGHAALIFIDNLPLHLARLDYRGLTRLADRIVEVSITNWKNAGLLAKGETQEYLDYCDYINEGLHLKHVKHLLSNYLEALLGYQIEISPASSPDTNGEKVYLPAVVKDFRDDDKNLLMYKVQSTHVEAHIEFGSFDFDISKVSDLVADVTQQYGNRVDSDAAPKPKSGSER